VSRRRQVASHLGSVGRGWASIAPNTTMSALWLGATASLETNTKRDTRRFWQLTFRCVASRRGRHPYGVGCDDIVSVHRDVVLR
jgi:hypothetical protein